jgi:hypothetical protein
MSEVIPRRRSLVTRTWSGMQYAVSSTIIPTTMREFAYQTVFATYLAEQMIVGRAQSCWYIDAVVLEVSNRACAIAVAKVTTDTHKAQSLATR